MNILFKNDINTCNNLRKKYIYLYFIIHTNLIKNKNFFYAPHRTTLVLI